MKVQYGNHQTPYCEKPDNEIRQTMVVRAASPVLLRVIALGAFFIYCTTIVMYPRPSVYTCTARVWLREIGFSLTYGALMLKTWRISVIFRVRSAKAVKITDFNLLKRLGVIVAIFTVFLVIRTLVSPPLVIVGRTADDLKAYLCPTDWWDHSFTTLEVIFLVWGIRLCIVVRKAPSEFNESRFISMAIYNEFLLSVFLNISMLFLQSPANPDLLYIIFFCHTQLTVTLLLCLIFGSKAYMVFKGHGKHELENSAPKTQTGKFVGKSRSDNSHYASTNSSATCLEYGKLTEADIQEEFRRLYTQLEQLKEKNMRFGNRHIGAKITAMQDAATRVPTVIEEPAVIRLSKSTDISKPSTSFAYQAEIEQLPSTSTQENKVPAGKSSKRLSVSFGPKSQSTSEEIKEDGKPTSKVSSPSENHQSNGTTTMDKDLGITELPANQNESSDIEMHTTTTTKSASTTAESPSKNNATTNSKSNRILKSGHARTHAIVINLDDKSRFTEEVTV
ncbi:probable G-protein coupled receptor CG31760 [Chrysoperla carnea]|uniref:probable G-protein coupled receptor CG31760 n=1 Tax=Chrysoperla carnea TaxID=189513 RepID=UPI001D084F1D|nr:probable G-protein coupled receptor CG31760 [Chrysoperla carnea]